MKYPGRQLFDRHPLLQNPLDAWRTTFHMFRTRSVEAMWEQELYRAGVQKYQGWVRIMNPRPFEHSVQFAKKHRDKGFTVRMRNIATGDIVLADIL